MGFLSESTEYEKNHQKQKHHKQNYMANNKLGGKQTCFSVRCKETHLGDAQTRQVDTSTSQQRLQGCNLPAQPLNTKRIW